MIEGNHWLYNLEIRECNAHGTKFVFTGETLDKRSRSKDQSNLRRKVNEVSKIDCPKESEFKYDYMHKLQFLKGTNTKHIPASVLPEKVTHAAETLPASAWGK